MQNGCCGGRATLWHRVAYFRTTILLRHCGQSPCSDPNTSCVSASDCSHSTRQGRWNDRWQEGVGQDTSGMSWEERKRQRQREEEDQEPARRKWVACVSSSVPSPACVCSSSNLLQAICRADVAFEVELVSIVRRRHGQLIAIEYVQEVSTEEVALARQGRDVVVVAFEQRQGQLVCLNMSLPTTGSDPTADSRLQWLHERIGAEEAERRQRKRRRWIQAELQRQRGGWHVDSTVHARKRDRPVS